MGAGKWWVTLGVNGVGCNEPEALRLAFNQCPTFINAFVKQIKTED